MYYDWKNKNKTPLGKFIKQIEIRTKQLAFIVIIIFPIAFLNKQKSSGRNLTQEVVQNAKQKPVQTAARPSQLAGAPS